MDFSAFKNHKGVFILSEVDTKFSEEYLALRKKENRILTDEEVKLLPIVSNDNINYSEWKIRSKTANRFIEYFQNKNQRLNILDIGCGNGWFTNKMSELNYNIVGIDVNLQELEQASRVFKNKNLKFVYCDIFQNNYLFKKRFDIITLNASVQYFSDFELLTSTLKSFLKPKGEIHILDSPFYESAEVDNAKQRTIDYYTKVGFPKMAKFYFHHTYNKIKDFTVLYQPAKSVLKKILSKKDSPFMWLKLLK